jgi:hypothetical protein
MTSKQQNKYTMYLAVKAVLDANSAVWQTLQAFADGCTVLTNQINSIQTLAQSQNLDTSGIALDKHRSKAAMALSAITIGSAVQAFAVKTQNHTLANEVDFSPSELVSARDAEALENCQNVHDLAASNLAGLADYGVTATKLATFQAVISAYGDIMDKPRQTIATGKTVTQQLGDAFAAADEILEEELDNLIIQFADTNAKFVSDYQNARIVVDVAASHASPNQTATAPAPAAPTGLKTGP